MNDVIDLAKRIQFGLPAYQSKLQKAQRHNGKPCSIDLTVYHGDRHFVVRVVEPDRLPEDDE